MDVSSPHRAVSPSLDGDVVVALARIDGELTGREIARLVPGSQRGVSNALSRLVDQGIVLRRDVGSAGLHQLNRDHIAADVVLAMAELRTVFLSRLRTALAGWDPAPLHASMFGSAARQDGDAKSDIDLLVVGKESDINDPRWLDQLDRLRDDTRRWTGNDVQLVVLGERECRELAADDRPDALVRNARTDAVDLAGAPAAKFLRPSRAKR